MAIERTARGWRLGEAEDAAGPGGAWHALRNAGGEPRRADAAAPGPWAVDTNGDGFDEVIDLTGLASRPGVGFVIQGDAESDRAGYSVSSAGDINGDGFDDFIVGAPRGDDGGTQAGEAYVIFGKASAFGTIDLTNLGSAGFVIQGDFDNDYAGYSVSSAGDVNGDGFDDLIVGAFRGDDGGSFNAGKAYVIFGKASGFGTIDLASLGGAGFTIQGDANYDTAGFSVASAGDVNGDGFDDVIVGAPRGDDGGSNAGEAYVIFGKSGGFGTIDLTSLGTAGFIIQGDANGDYAGWSVASAGDINGDGFDDVIVGARYGDDGGSTNAGEAYVIFGKASGFGTIDLTSLGSAGFTIQGDMDFDRLGISVASAGDFNGDGFDDLIVGAPYAARSGSTGQAYVIFGKASGFGTIDVADIGDAGFIIQGAAGFDDAGRGVSSAGDVNGDGFDDLIVGAPFGSDGGSFAGGAYVIFGKASGFGTIDLSTFHPSNPGFDPDAGFFIQGDASGDRAGTSVAGAGDINDDGFDDFIVGAPYGNDGGAQAGEAYVLFGHAPTIAVTRIGSAASQAIRGGAFDDTLDGREGDDQLFGAAGNDALIGGTGNDTLNGGAGADAMDGGSGDDVYVVDDAGDQAIEAQGGGNDLVYALADYALTQGSEVETLSAIDWTFTTPLNLSGNGFANTIFGNAGANFLDGGGGADAMVGFGGDDVYIVDDAGDQVIEASGQGSDLVYALTSWQLTANSSVETLSAIDWSATNALNLTGNGLANVIYGNAGANFLNGGGGADVMVGFGGDDVYIVDDAGDAVNESAGQGNDLVYALADYTLTPGSSVETLSAIDWSQTNALNLTGNGFANTLYGNAGANFLNGGGGADAMTGFGGDDVYIVDDAGDAVNESAGQGSDVVYALANWALTANSAVEILSAIDWSATNALNLTGNGLANTIYGNAGANFLNGGAGADAMTGFGGDDVYIVDDAGDQAIEAQSGGNDTVYALADYTLTQSSSVETLSAIDWSQTNALNLTGNGLANTIYGNAGANLLDGGLGADTLRGFGGADTFAFTTALGNGNVDAIVDFVGGTDRIALDDAVFTGLGVGALNANAFVIGASAGDADDRIIYNSATGQLFYDADGNGAGAAVLFATLQAGTVLAASDFTVI